ncbi:MAG: hypothetical protein GM45_6070 [actinobacterium acAMD-5]|nr:MAG: hypothetical protein GM45_6070 [actinobacterium acAMD-5]
MPSSPKPAPLPRGEGLVWSVIGTLLSGPIVWGFIGALVDRQHDTDRTFLAIGVVVGAVVSMYVVYLRFGRETAEEKEKRSQS